VRRVVFALALLALATVRPLDARAQAPVPAPNGPVNDFANILDDATEARLRALIEGVERDTTAEIAVATVPSLDGSAVEEVATRYFNTWGVGQKALNNGVLLLVAPNEREVRIEVGYGLEPILPDGLAGEIIRKTVLPKFKDGDYPGGITATPCGVCPACTDIDSGARRGGPPPALAHGALLRDLPDHRRLCRRLGPEVERGILAAVRVVVQRDSRHHDADPVLQRAAEVPGSVVPLHGLVGISPDEEGRYLDDAERIVRIIAGRRIGQQLQRLEQQLVQRLVGLLVVFVVELRRRIVGWWRRQRPLVSRGQARSVVRTPAPASAFHVAATLLLRQAPLTRAASRLGGSARPRSHGGLL
jgi:hypothetical protein